MEAGENIFFNTLSQIKDSAEFDGFREPFHLPVNYFDNFTVALLAKLHAEDEADPAFLNKLPRHTPFHIPEGYLENFSPSLKKAELKRTPLPITWFRKINLKAAAILVGITIVSGIIYFQRTHQAKKNNTIAAQDEIAKLNNEQLRQLDEENSFTLFETRTNPQDDGETRIDLNQFFKHFSNKELSDFLDETAAGEDDYFIN